MTVCDLWYSNIGVFEFLICSDLLSVFSSTGNKLILTSTYMLFLTA